MAGFNRIHVLLAALALTTASAFAAKPSESNDDVRALPIYDFSNDGYAERSYNVHNGDKLGDGHVEVRANEIFTVITDSADITGPAVPEPTVDLSSIQAVFSSILSVLSTATDDPVVTAITESAPGNSPQASTPTPSSESTASGSNFTVPVLTTTSTGSAAATSAGSATAPSSSGTGAASLQNHPGQLVWVSVAAVPALLKLAGLF